LKALREKEDELKKLKLGTNHERIVEIIEEITTMLDSIENEYYEANKDKEQKIFEDSIVTDVDITKEIHKLEKVEQLKKI